MADAEAICEAAQRPTMRFVAVKSETKQASSVIFRTRDLLVRQRTQVINAIRGHLAEYGLIAPQGPSHVDRLVSHIENPDSGIPEAARSCLNRLVDMIRALHEEITALDAEIAARAKRDGMAKRLMTVPGIGPVIAHPTARNFQVRARLCGLDRLDAFTEIDRRKAENGTDLAHGRANLAAPLDHSVFGRRALGEAQGHAGWFLAGADACPQASPAAS
jgi:hypothetical protein